MGAPRSSLEGEGVCRGCVGARVSALGVCVGVLAIVNVDFA